MRKLRWTALGFTLILVVSLFASTAAALPNPYYDVHVVVTGNGDAWTNVSRAHAGDTVSITVRADAGYELEDITVVPGESLWEVSWDEDSSWFEPSRWFDDEDWSAPDLGSDDTIQVNRWNRFTMPHNDVTVWVRFSDDGCDGSWPGCPSYRFTDVEADAWYHEAVDYAVSCGFLDGVSKTSFDPDGAVTRAMTWLVLGRVSGNRNLEDCSPWYADAQAWAKNHQITDGKNPTAAVTRQELITMLYRWYGSPKVSGSLAGYRDGALVASWAKDAMVWALREGLVGIGSSTLAPDRVTTRAELAVVLQRLNNL